MNMHKNTRLTPHHCQAIWPAYTQEKESVTSPARRYQVSRVTIYRALKAARSRLLKPQTSTNNRFKQAKYGMKRLAKVERSIQEKLKKQAKRYDNGTEYKGSANHAFGVACYENGIGQKFTRVARLQTNGKSERVIRTLMEMWHEKQSFDSPEHRQKELCRFVNFYNTVKPHWQFER